MFHDFIFLKYNLKDIYRKNPIKGFFYHKFYKFKVKRLLSKLYNNSVDVELLKGFHEFLTLTNIHISEEFKKLYSIILFSDKNSIKFVIDTDISFTISIYNDNRINILYNEGEFNNYIYETRNDILNFNKRDSSKKQILFNINEKIIDVMIASIMTFFDKDRKG